MAITIKKKKYPPIEKVPDDPENLKLSKKDFVAKQAKRKENEKKIKKFREDLIKENELPEKKRTGPINTEIDVIEEELTSVINRIAEVEADPDKDGAQDRVVKLKKQASLLRMKLGKARKAKKES